jgi:predicted enzyme related to lactoylglutathione lyase
MKHFIPIILIITIFSCNHTKNKTTTMADKTKQTGNTVSSNDTTPKVTGIGGIFFFSENPEKTREWYAKNLGLEVNQWGSSFEFRNANRPEEINYLQWSPFQKGSDYFAPSKKDFMINYRVQNIEGLVNKLKESGVVIVDDIETYDYGKFVHIMDEEGNKIELWEPVDSVLTSTGGKTTK